MKVRTSLLLTYFERRNVLQAKVLGEKEDRADQN